jgi:hypothetical protein
MLPDLERAERIGEFWSYPRSRAFAELLIDCEEDRDAEGGAPRDVTGGRAVGSFLGRAGSPRTELRAGTTRDEGRSPHFYLSVSPAFIDPAKKPR